MDVDELASRRLDRLSEGPLADDGDGMVDLQLSGKNALAPERRAGRPLRTIGNGI